MEANGWLLGLLMWLFNSGSFKIKEKSASSVVDPMGFRKLRSREERRRGCRPGRRCSQHSQHLERMYGRRQPVLVTSHTVPGAMEFSARPFPQFTFVYPVLRQSGWN